MTVRAGMLTAGWAARQAGMAFVMTLWLGAGPGQAASDTATSGTATPGVTTPGMTKPGMTKPGMTTPDMATMPGMSAPNTDAASAAPQASAHVGDLTVSGGFVRAMLPGQPVGGGYLTIRNDGATDDRLVSISSPVAGRVELHDMAMQGAVMRMRRLDDGLAVPARQTISLQPGGTHMMFLKVKTPFRQGNSVIVHLRFEKAGEVDMILPVFSAGMSGQE
ncbi:MAG: copper chaperone PCu(A)C [Neorhizobium sp.]|nr:copper chaperone PCu(A)C [Neorhizobium sp.]